MLLFSYLFTLLLPLPMLIQTQPLPDLSSRKLDAILQNYAFQALHRPQTGVPHAALLPADLAGITVAALRLRSGSMGRRGFDSYHEFRIPIGVFEQPYVERLVLVYHNLANFSVIYYPLPGYSFLVPVVGLLAYNGSDLSGVDLPELDIRPMGDPILIRFRDLRRQPGNGSSPKCVYFDLNGSVEFDNVVDGNVCVGMRQGHFSIVVEEGDIAPAPAPGGEGGGGEGRERRWVIGVVVGGFVLVVLLGVLVVLVKKCRRRKKVERMELAADRGVPLLTATVGRGKVPVAAGIRTRPVLENEYGLY